MKLKLMIAVIAILWAGMLLAIGMESVVKFATPSLTKPVGFDVGRTVFGAFNKVQIVLLLFIFIGMMLVTLQTLDKFLIYAIAVILLLQVFWLFPILSSRVDVILAGNKPAPSFIHGLYGLMEVMKLCCLSVLGLHLVFK